MSAYPMPARKGPGDYQVQPGDSLWSIAKAHDVSVPQLVKANQIGPKEVLRVGQRLDIPGSSGAATQAGVPAAIPAVARNTVRKVRYGVRRGDSLALIASKFNVGVHDLARWNALDVQRYLQPGQSLLIYVDVAAAAE
jgi:membrane-bound lytic murein transglycosylase D